MLNKCDLVSKGEQTALRAKVTELAQEHNRNFKEVFFVSAKSGNGVSQLRVSKRMRERERKREEKEPMWCVCVCVCDHVCLLMKLFFQKP